MATGDGIKVLIVDDEADLRIGLLSILKLKGFEVTSASSGEDAFLLVQKQVFDVIISDITMPHGDGLWLLKKVRALDLTVPFILTTGNSDISEESVKQAGAFGLLRKPVSAAGHIAMINGALKEARSNSGRQAGTRNEVE